jgi:hypothetical protein
METVTYSDEAVSDFIRQHFVAVRIPVKEQRDVVEKYLVSWTPTVIVADHEGQPHYRVEGYLSPEDMLQQLLLAEARLQFDGKEFDAAAKFYGEVVTQYPGTDAAAEAMYWSPVAAYKRSHDKSQLLRGWKELREKMPDSAWARRATIPKTG